MFGCARARSSSARSISRPVASRWCRMRRRVWPPSRPSAKPAPFAALASAASNCTPSRTNDSITRGACSTTVCTTSG